MADYMGILKMAELTNDQLEQLAEGLGKLGNSVDENLALEERIKKQREKNIEAEKKNFSKAETNLGLLSDRVKEGSISAEELNSELKSLRSQIDKTSSATEKAHLMEMKSSLEQTNSKMQASKILKDSLWFGVGATSAKVSSAMMGVVKSAMSSSDALSLAAEIMKAGWDVANTATQAGATGLKDFGKEAAGAGGAIGAMGKTASVVGAGVSILGDAVSGLAKSGIDFLLAKTKVLLTDFSKMSSAGAIYTGGLMSMVSTANSAGLTLDQFSKIVSANKDNLSGLGIGVAEASKRLAGAMKAGGESARNGMFALGMSMEEQGEAFANTMRIMAGPSGQLKSSNAEVAAQTQEYAKNLKVISSITGEDVKTKQDAIRKSNDTLFMKQKIDAMEPAQRAKFIEMQATMNEEDMRALTEKMKYGAVVSTDLAVAGSLSAGVTKKWEAQYNAVRDGSASMEKGAQIQAEAQAEIQRNVKDQTAVSIATGDAAVSGSLVLSKQWDQTSKYSADSVDAAKKAAKKQMDAGKGGKDMAANLMSAQQKFAVGIEGIAVNHLPKFASALTTTLDTMKTTIDLGLNMAGWLATINPMFSVLAGVGVQLASAFGLMLMAGRAKGGGGLGKNAVDTFANTSGGFGKNSKAAGGAGSKLGESLSGIGKGADSLDKGNKGTGGFLQGLAKGIGAFGVPPVPLGVAIITGALTVGMLAFAAALRIAQPALEPFGKALKSLFEGVGTVVVSIGTALATVITGVAKSFTLMADVNPFKLLALAPGILAVGASLGLSAVGIGAFALAGGRGTLESISESYKRIESLDPDKLIKVANAMGKVNDNMPSVGQALLGGLSSVAGRMFGGDEKKTEAASNAKTNDIANQSKETNDVATLLKLQIELLKQLTDDGKEHKDISYSSKKLLGDIANHSR